MTARWLLLGLVACGFPKPDNVAVDSSPPIDATADAAPPNALLSFGFATDHNPALLHDLVGAITGTRVDVYGFAVVPTDLIPTFTTGGAVATVDNIEQRSEIDPQDFTTVVHYVVGAPDQQPTDYAVHFHARTVLSSGLTATMPMAFGVGDLDRDGVDDIAFSRGDNKLQIALGVKQAPPAKLALQTAVVLSAAASVVAVADLDGNGYPEIAYGGPTLALRTLTNLTMPNKAMSFSPAVVQPFGAGMVGIAVGDLDINHEPDIALAIGDDTERAILAISNTPQGTLASSFNVSMYPDLVEKDLVHGIVTLDADGDGSADLALLVGDEIHLHLNAGTPSASSSTFHESQERSLPAPGAVELAVGDFDGDGHQDLVTVADGGATVFVDPAQGANGTMLPVTYPVAHVCPIDLDHDGRTDLVTLLDDGSGVVIAHYAIATKSGFAFPTQTASWKDSGPFTCATGDFDGDGTTDVAVVGVGLIEILAISQTD